MGAHTAFAAPDDVLHCDRQGFVKEVHTRLACALSRLPSRVGEKVEPLGVGIQSRSGVGVIGA